MKKLLILYSEVMPYNMACFVEVVKNFDVEIFLIQWKAKKLTPYEISETPGIHTYDREGFTNAALIDFAIRLDPSVVFVSGWMDKGYLNTCLELKRKGKKILCGLDNQWKADLKQRLGILLLKVYVARYFTHCFVPGVRQYEYARRLGFAAEKIMTGAYTADTAMFYSATRTSKERNKILFVGRFNKIKGVDLLTTAFLNVITENGLSNGWELVLIGNGPEKTNIPNSPNIKVYDFMSQEEISRMLGEVSFFCLPSRKEPWGVVIHEMAAARLPLLLSDECGAAVDYLVDGYNGYYFESENIVQLEEKMRLLMVAPGKQLQAMGDRSFQISLANSPEKWAYKLYTLFGK